MNRKITLIHRILTLISILILSASLVFYLTKWTSFPDEIGVHFGPDGQYDVVASKFYGFYPHVVGGILITGIALANFFIQKKSTGLKITETGEQHFKTELCLTLDCLSVLLSLFFANWSRTVSLQIVLDLNFMVTLENIMFAVSAAGIIAELITCQRHKIKTETPQNSKLMHRLCRLIAWLLTFSAALLLAFIWERLPLDEAFYANPEYYGLTYFANLDAYLDKKLLLIPQICIILLLIILEIISFKAVKANKTALVALTDKLKLLNGLFFFWWNLLLAFETKIGNISICLFIGFYILFFVIYFKKEKSDSP